MLLVVFSYVFVASNHTMAAASTNITVYIDNKIEKYKAVLLNKEGPMIPIKLMAEKLKYEFKYDGHKGYRIILDNTEYTFMPNKSEILVNGEPKFTLDLYPRILNGTLMVDYRFFTEILRYTAKYDASNNSLKFSSKRQPAEDTSQLSLSDIKPAAPVFVYGQENMNLFYWIRNKLYIDPDVLAHVFDYEYDYTYDKQKTEFILNHTNQLLIINKEKVTFNSKTINEEGILTLRTSSGAIDSYYVQVEPILKAWGFGIKIGKNKIEVSSPNTIASNDFLLALRNNDYSQVKRLLEQGENPNALDANGYPVISSVLVKKDEIFKLLLDYGADPNVRLGPNRQSLLLSITNIDLLNYSLEKGANPNAYNVYGSILQRYAMDLNFEFVSSLVKYGADIEYLDRDGNSILMLMLSKQLYFSEIRAENMLRIMELLLSKGADLNIKNGNGATALSLAISNNYSDEILDLLVRYGAK